jgi:hypothetical protein
MTASHEENKLAQNKCVFVVSIVSIGKLYWGKAAAFRQTNERTKHQTLSVLVLSSWNICRTTVYECNIFVYK